MTKLNINIPVEQSRPRANAAVQLIFDVYTPRPHFIIVHRKPFRKATATEREIREVMHLSTDFLFEQSQYDTDAILSFHRGKWYQQNFKHFHAHLCVSKKAYCQEAKRQVRIFVNTSATHDSVSFQIIPENCRNFWLSPIDYLNQMEKDLLSAKVKYNQYRDQCLAMASRCLNDPVSYQVPLFQFSTSQFALVFLASSPRIGVVARKTNVPLTALYHFMENFYLTARKKLSAINPLYENFGIHLCLHVSGMKKHDEHLVERPDRILFNGIQRIKTERIVGYIQMEEQLYLRWLPASFHRTWLSEFRACQHLVLT